MTQKGQRTVVRSRLARVRVEKGLYRHELAQATGISYASLYRLESGLVENPPLWWYQNCAIALGVKLEDILDDQHTGWRASAAAPKAPDAKWLRTKAAAKGIAPPERLRTSALAADG